MANIVQKGSLIYLRLIDSFGLTNKWYYYDQRNKPLGSGAMGTVYLGYSCASNEPVAIKRVVDKYANISSIRQRAILEATLQFRHEHLIEMLGYSELQPNSGPLFILSHYINGENIDEYVRHTLHSNIANRPQKICQLFYPVLDALSYIHSKSIVHMDIKPSNIIVENGRNVRLMDLGIAHVGKKIDIEGSSSLMGTPKYAAPEQFELSAESKLNSRTDIYEAGVTLYELLSGRNPFTATNLDDSIRMHKTVILPYTDNVPRKLVDVLRKATCPNQENRYRSAIEFKSAIEQALIPEQKVSWIKYLVAAIIVILFILVFVLWSVK